MLLPIALHEEDAYRVPRARMAREPAKADGEMTSPARSAFVDAARRQRTSVLRVMENYLFYEPLIATQSDASTPASSARSAGTT